MALTASRKLLITGFGPFGDITDNPSGRILPALDAAVRKACGADITLESRKLEVKFGAIEACSPSSFDIVISLGVDAATTSIRVETRACNCFTDLQDNEVCIDKALPREQVIVGDPLPTLPNEVGNWTVTQGTATSAGKFVCNQTYYNLCTVQGTKGYFIHIPNIPKASDADFVQALTELICKLVAASTASK